MAVTMVIGNRHEISASLFAPGYTMASLIANEFSEATDDLHLSALMAVGVRALFVITLIVNAIARWLVWRDRRGNADDRGHDVTAARRAARQRAVAARTARTLRRRRIVSGVMVG